MPERFQLYARLIKVALRHGTAAQIKPNFAATQVAFPKTDGSRQRQSLNILLVEGQILPVARCAQNLEMKVAI